MCLTMSNTAYVLGYQQLSDFCILICYSIGMEMVGPSMRLWTGTLIHAFFTLGLVILSGIAYVLRDWRNLELAIAVPNVVYLTYYW